MNEDKWLIRELEKENQRLKDRVVQLDTAITTAWLSILEIRRSLLENTKELH